MKRLIFAVVLLAIVSVATPSIITRAGTSLDTIGTTAGTTVVLVKTERQAANGKLQIVSADRVSKALQDKYGLTANEAAREIELVAARVRKDGCTACAPMRNIIWFAVYSDCMNGEGGYAGFSGTEAQCTSDADDAACTYVATHCSPCGCLP
jgi:hypothetical protein